MSMLAIFQAGFSKQGLRHFITRPRSLLLLYWGYAAAEPLLLGNPNLAVYKQFKPAPSRHRSTSRSIFGWSGELIGNPFDQSVDQASMPTSVKDSILGKVGPCSFKGGGYVAMGRSNGLIYLNLGSMRRHTPVGDFSPFFVQCYGSGPLNFLFPWVRNGLRLDLSGGATWLPLSAADDKVQAPKGAGLLNLKVDGVFRDYSGHFVLGISVPNSQEFTAGKTCCLPASYMALRVNLPFKIDGLLAGFEGMVHHPVFIKLSDVNVQDARILQPKSSDPWRTEAFKHPFEIRLAIDYAGFINRFWNLKLRVRFLLDGKFCFGLQGGLSHKRFYLSGSRRNLAVNPMLLRGNQARWKPLEIDCDDFQIAAIKCN